MIDFNRIQPPISPVALVPSRDSGRIVGGDLASSSHELGVKLPVDAPPEVQLVTQMLLASGSSDPIEALMGVLHQIRAMSGNRAELDVKSAEQSKEVARLNNEKAIEDAKAAAEKRLKGAPKWVKALVSAIVTAVGVVAAGFTGGTSLGLAIAGAALLLSADHLAKLGLKLGMSEKAAGWMKLGLQVAGAALMLGAGFAGSATATIPKAMSVTKKTVKVLKAAMGAVEAGIGMVDADRAYKQARAEGESSRTELEVEASDAELDEAIQVMAAELARMQRQTEAVTKMSETKRQTTQSILDQPPGGPR